MNTKLREHGIYEHLTENLTKSGINDFAKRKHNYLKMEELTKLNKLTKTEQIEILLYDIDKYNSKTTEESFSF